MLRDRDKEGQHQLTGYAGRLGLKRLKSRAPSTILVPHQIPQKIYRDIKGGITLNA